MSNLDDQTLEILASLNAAQPSTQQVDYSQFMNDFQPVQNYPNYFVPQQGLLQDTPVLDILSDLDVMQQRPQSLLDMLDQYPTLESDFQRSFAVSPDTFNMNIYQRLPYLAAIFVSFMGYNYSTNDKILILIIMIFTISTIISGYHFGIENSIFDELSACTNELSDILNKSKLLESLNKTMPVNCKDATFKILGVSLAAINTILSILIVIFSIRTLAYERN